MKSGPPRLTDPASQSPLELRGMLKAGQLELPDAGRLQTLSQRLAPALGAAVPHAAAATVVTTHAATGTAVTQAATAAALTQGATTVSASPAAVGLVTLVKLGVPICAALGFAVGMLVRGQTPLPSLPPPSLPAPTIASEQGTAPGPAPRSTPPITPTSESPSLSAPVFAHASEHASGPTYGHTPPAPGMAVSALPANPTPLAMSATAPAAPTEAPSAVIAAQPSDTELALLQDAADRVRNDPDGALALVDRHAQRFPSGALIQEREVIGIEALVLLHRDGEAAARAARFFRDFPASAHRPRVLALLGKDATDAASVGSLHNP